MAFTTRRVDTKADTEKLHHIWSWVWSSEPPKKDDPLSAPDPGEIRLLGELDGKLACGLKIHDYEVARGRADLKCGGVGAVATLPETRGKGCATEFMVEALRQMKEAGHLVSNLYAYREPFYRKLGYETCGWRWQIKAPQGRMAKTEQQLEARQIMAGEMGLLESCYTQFVRGLSGSVLRKRHNWSNRIGKKPRMVYAVGDPVEAYAWVKITDFWGDVEVGELAWSSLRGYDSIMSVLRNLCVNQNRVVWLEPPNSVLLARDLDHGVEMCVNEPTMYRAISVQGALAALKPESTGEFTIEVGDEHLPENRGPWIVRFTPECVSVEKTDKATITIDIRQFSQALMGSPSLHDLATAGLLETSDANALRDAEKLLTPMPVVCMEFF
ncbi:MAG: GNAT family N-acetyltransferase [Armatimonadetes bacterium]|nr:GNAT family N-acetyltransferase [Armatimonadota bacterium]